MRADGKEGKPYSPVLVRPGAGADRQDNNREKRLCRWILLKVSVEGSLLLGTGRGLDGGTGLCRQQACLIIREHRPVTMGGTDLHAHSKARAAARGDARAVRAARSALPTDAVDAAELHKIAGLSLRGLADASARRRPRLAEARADAAAAHLSEAASLAPYDVAALHTVASQARPRAASGEHFRAPAALCRPAGHGTGIAAPSEQ